MDFFVIIFLNINSIIFFDSIACNWVSSANDMRVSKVCNCKAFLIFWLKLINKRYHGYLHY